MKYEPCFSQELKDYLDENVKTINFKPFTFSQREVHFQKYEHERNYFYKVVKYIMFIMSRFHIEDKENRKYYFYLGNCIVLDKETKKLEHYKLQFNHDDTKDKELLDIIKMLKQEYLNFEKYQKINYISLPNMPIAEIMNGKNELYDHRFIHLRQKPYGKGFGYIVNLKGYLNNVFPETQEWIEYFQKFTISHVKINAFLSKKWHNTKIALLHNMIKKEIKQDYPLIGHLVYSLSQDKVLDGSFIQKYNFVIDNYEILKKHYRENKGMYPFVNLFTQKELKDNRDIFTYTNMQEYFIDEDFYNDFKKNTSILKTIAYYEFINGSFKYREIIENNEKIMKWIKDYHSNSIKELSWLINMYFVKTTTNPNHCNPYYHSHKLIDKKLDDNFKQVAKLVFKHKYKSLKSSYKTISAYCFYIFQITKDLNKSNKNKIFHLFSKLIDNNHCDLSLKENLEEILYQTIETIEKNKENHQVSEKLCL